MISPDSDKQKKLAAKIQIKYKAGIGELIWSMSTCRPDIAFTSIKLSQSNCPPAEYHYHGLKHTIRYVYITQNDGIYFWPTSSCPEFPEGTLPTVNSNQQDIDHGCPDHKASTTIAYGDSWLHALKHEDPSAVSASNRQGVPSHTR